MSRLFWLLVCGVSWYFCSLFLVETWNVYENNPISFVIETDYLRWNTSFPAVSVCEENNDGRVFEVADQLLGKVHDYNLDDVIKEISYFRETTFYINHYCVDNMACPQTGLQKIAVMVRSPCEDVFESCRWNSVAFNCCSRFIPVYTEVGTCYTINSLHDRGKELYPLMVSNRSTGPGVLDLEIKIPSRVHLHSAEEVPFLNSPEGTQALEGAQVVKRFAVREVRNEEDVEWVDAELRRCRFPWEVVETAYDHYSYGGCVVHCRVRHQLQKCNCTPPLIPGAGPESTCNMSGLLCLTKVIGKLAVLKSEWNEARNGIYCPCFPSCDEIEIDTIEEYATRTPGRTRHVRMIMDRLPSERFLRHVVRGKLDLVVALGGTCSLFVGASLLSAVELVYYFAWKMWFSGRGKGSSDGDKAAAEPRRRARKLGKRLKRQRERALSPFMAQQMVARGPPPRTNRRPLVY
ncbi:acid-sensing ion channel 4-B-like [Ischnura elegans]|uniref:acid-sensing ion channel 4-B-like n=1 Tax=Ischnura elegans TaxID=197161 RepID=UPI001ED87780|nr:acid-sensing ion channel 4-B-like [Ischnura elegans]